jgi:hypothetical protein
MKLRSFGTARAQAVGQMTEVVQTAAGKVLAVGIVALVVACVALVVALVKR